MKKILFSILFLILFCSIASAFSFANLIGYVVKNNVPTVDLLIPKNDGVTSELVFSWLYKDEENNPQTQYLLQVDDDWRFETPYNFYGLDKNTITIDVSLPERTYYWRVQVKDIYGWSDWSDWRKFDLDLSIKTCVDGTAFWACSYDIPKYCDGGSLVEDCRRCGCAINEICQLNGLCLVNACLDGTRYGDCSKYLPKYCQNGKLIDVCSLCGCAEGLECETDGSCTSVRIIIKDQELSQSRTLLEYIVNFFKNLFGSL